MRILVTGSSGFIGKHLTRRLENEHTVIPFDIKKGWDVKDPFDLKEVDCDLIIHLAALCVVSESWEAPVEYFENNIYAVANLLALNKPIIFASSGAAKDAGSSPYALSKRAGEMLLDDHTILRLGNVYGSGQLSSYGRVIDSFVSGAREGKITIYGDGHQTRDFVHISDVVEAFVLAIDSKPSLYEIGTGQPTSINSLKDIIIEMYGEAEVVYLDQRDEQRHVVMSIGKAQKELGYQPRVSLKEGLQITYPH